MISFPMVQWLQWGKPNKPSQSPTIWGYVSSSKKWGHGSVYQIINPKWENNGCNGGVYRMGVMGWWEEYSQNPTPEWAEQPIIIQWWVFEASTPAQKQWLWIIIPLRWPILSRIVSKDPRFFFMPGFPPSLSWLHRRFWRHGQLDHTFIWLVGDLPLWKILVSWDYSSQYDGKNKQCSKPPTSSWLN